MPSLLRSQALDIRVPLSANAATTRDLHTYKPLESNTLLVRQLNWEIHPGESWAILGPNGAGKSRLLQVLSGLQQPEPNTLYWRGQPFSTQPSRQRAQQLGLVLQQPSTGLQNTTLDMVLSGRYPAHTGWYTDNAADRRIAYQALAEVGLSHKADVALTALSGGEHRRADIARLLVQNPTLAMLDEPLNHLDVSQQLNILQVLRHHFQTSEQALIMVLHDLNLARHIATHCLLLYGDGRWRAGTIQATANVSTLSELMGYPLLEYDTPSGKRLGVDYPTFTNVSCVLE